MADLMEWKVSGKPDNAMLSKIMEALSDFNGANVKVVIRKLKK